MKNLASCIASKNASLKESMNLTELELPSNRVFGFFFSFIFIALGVYFYLGKSFVLAKSLSVVGFLFLVVAIVKADALLSLNKLWMRFGLLLGMIIGPIVLGAIFFGLFTPISLVMRLSGRDELRLRFGEKSSYWISRESSQIESDAFKNQF